jgi:ATP-dependent DNA helicase RecG
MKFVKCADEGTRRMRDTMQEMELPAPEFSVKQNGNALVRVTLRNNIKHRRVWIDKDAIHLMGETLYKTLNEKERKIINYIDEYKKINVNQIQRLLNAGWEVAKKVLVGLVTKGILTQIHRKDLERDPKACFVLKGGASRN